jgi:hypothetical protein
MDKSEIYIGMPVRRINSDLRGTVDVIRGDTVTVFWHSGSSIGPYTSETENMAELYEPEIIKMRSRNNVIK